MSGARCRSWPPWPRPSTSARHASLSASRPPAEAAAEWKAALLEALHAGLDVEAGLHDELHADADLVAAAAAGGATLRDLRAVPADLSTPTGEGRDLP